MVSILLHAVWVIAALTHTFAAASQTPLLSNEPGRVGDHEGERALQAKGRKLHGRFLQITDIHPDPYYKAYSSTEAGVACHRNDGPAGYYGAETSDCDSPITLVNATFKWIQENLKDKIDFVVWTGDSARHDNDENIPRTEENVLRSNTMLVAKFKEVFGATKDDSPRIGAFEIPIVPTFGNNDMLPHNIFTKGPNKWTRQYLRVWRDIVPEEQRHGFDRGGWFYVEVIPNHLAVFSLNTMYFFDSNSAVDGCAGRREPGYQHMEWLRIQLSFLRQRGMKAILTGHVPPARTAEKANWDETCWQKYTLWMQQYRDVIVGSLYGHMNIEHFLLQDFHDIDLDVAAGLKLKGGDDATWALTGDSSDTPISIKMSASDYINSLRKQWADLPSFPPSLQSASTKHSNDSRQEKEWQAEQRKFHAKVGGQYAERYSVSQVSASLVPNYFPTLRVFEYNITGLEHLRLLDTWASTPAPETEEFLNNIDVDAADLPESSELRKQDLLITRPHFTIPQPPSKHAPPGPAYSPQTLSFIGYTQYFSNLTDINNDFNSTSTFNPDPQIVNLTDTKDTNIELNQNTDTTDDIHDLRWRNGKHHDRQPAYRWPHPKPFTFEVEYDTRNKSDSYGFRSGLSVMKWLRLAATAGEYKPRRSKNNIDMEEGTEYDMDEEAEYDIDSLLDLASDSGPVDEEDDINNNNNNNNNTKDESTVGEETSTEQEETPTEQEETNLDPENKDSRKKHRKHKHSPSKKRRKQIEKTWFAVASRGIVGTLDAEELVETFG